ncbi:MAG: hypothetical protein VXY77_02230 [Pseudomonadota bacterium]|nr:hypothetical protein [Pseudomonadota bacterium]
MKIIQNISISRLKSVCHTLLRWAYEAINGVVARYRGPDLRVVYLDINKSKISFLESSAIQERMNQSIERIFKFHMVRYGPVYEYFEDLKSSLHRLMPKNSLAQYVLAQEDIRSCVFSHLRPDDFKKTRLYAISDVQGCLVLEELGNGGYRLPDSPENHWNNFSDYQHQVTASQYRHHLQTHIERLMPPKSAGEKVFNQPDLKDKIFGFISDSDMRPAKLKKLVIDQARHAIGHPHDLEYPHDLEDEVGLFGGRGVTWF